MSREDLEMAAVQRDSVTINALANRAVTKVALADPAVRALAAWVEYVDNGVDDTAPFDMSVARPLTGAEPSGRGRRTMLIAGSTALALVVSAGAAAAVTGDPFAVVKAPLHALGKVNPFDDGETNARERLPVQTPTKAQANKLLADARRAVAQGHPQKAQRLIVEAKGLLGDSASPGQQKVIDSMTDELAESPGQSGGDHGKPDPADASGNQGTGKPDPADASGNQGTGKPDPADASGNQGTGKPDPADASGNQGTGKPDPADASGNQGTGKPDPGDKPVGPDKPDKTDKSEPGPRATGKGKPSSASMTDLTTG